MSNNSNNRPKTRKFLTLQTINNDKNNESNSHNINLSCALCGDPVDITSNPNVSFIPPIIGFSTTLVVLTRLTSSIKILLQGFLPLVNLNMNNTFVSL